MQRVGNSGRKSTWRCSTWLPNNARAARVQNPIWYYGCRPRGYRKSYGEVLLLFFIFLTVSYIIIKDRRWPTHRAQLLHSHNVYIQVPYYTFRKRIATARPRADLNKAIVSLRKYNSVRYTPVRTKNRK